MTTTVVHLLRHGEVHNPARIVYGRLPDFHLSETGSLMADLAASWFATRDIAALYSSPLDRAQETARPVAERFGLPIRTDDRLIEAGNEFQGRRMVSARSLTDPQALLMLCNPFRPSWGEAYRDVATRMVDIVKVVRKEAWGREAVCVSHQLPIWMARRSAERKPLWHHRRQCNLASVTSLTFEEQELVSVGYCEPAAELYGPGPTVAGA